MLFDEVPLSIFKRGGSAGRLAPPNIYTFYMSYMDISSPPPKATLVAASRSDSSGQLELDGRDGL